MKKVLYITNIEVPYRVRFFNELGKHCDLTVLCEQRKNKTRNQNWTSSIERQYKVEYLHGLKYATENVISFDIIKYVLKKYDVIVIGCHNSPAQILGTAVMRLMHIPYYLNLDGEPFMEGKKIKSKLKRFLLDGAQKYLVAGEKAAESVHTFFSDKEAIPYYFSSLTMQELKDNRSVADRRCSSQSILVVGQYYDCKGMDVALETAKMDFSKMYKFVGMGNRTEQFLKEHIIPENVTVIPFLSKKELEEEYRNCRMLVLPSRQECWGLVINEAASFGVPIVSTWGSGAAIEYLSDKYPQYLAAPGDKESLYHAIIELEKENNLLEYSKYLLDKSEVYSIEKSVQIHLRAFGIAG